MANTNIKKFLDEVGLKHLVGILKTKFNGLEEQIPSDFYTKNEVDGKIANVKSEIIGGAGEDYDTLKEIEEWVEEHQELYEALVSGIAKKADADKVYTKNDVYTKDEVNGLIEGVDVSEQLKDYYKKSETYSKTEVANEISKAVENFITEEALEGYATEEYVDDAIDGLSEVYQPKGNYLTDHQSLEGYAKTTEVASAIEEAINKISAISNEEISSLFEEIF